MACRTGEACGLTLTRSAASQIREPQRRHHRDQRGARGLVPADLQPVGVRRAHGWRDPPSGPPATARGAGRHRDVEVGCPRGQACDRASLEVGDQVLRGPPARSTCAGARHRARDSRPPAVGQRGRVLRSRVSTPPSDTAWVISSSTCAGPLGRAESPGQLERRPSPPVRPSGCRSGRADRLRAGPDSTPARSAGCRARPATRPRAPAARCTRRGRVGRPAMQQVRRPRVEHPAGDGPDRTQLGGVSRRSVTTTPPIASP